MSCKEKRCPLEKWTIALISVGLIIGGSNALTIYHSFGLFWCMFVTIPLLAITVSAILDLIEVHLRRKERKDG